jgi:flagellar operon protein
MGNKINSEILSRITSKPQSKVGKLDQLKNAKKNEFQELFQKHVDNAADKSDLQISKHAAKRLEERNLSIDSSEYLKLKEAVNKLQSKGGKESLVVTSNAAYIVDVNKNKIVTAIDKEKMSENVFTNIDSTVFVG